MEDRSRARQDDHPSHTSQNPSRPTKRKSLQGDQAASSARQANPSRKASASSASKKRRPATTDDPILLRERIARRAYELYEERLRHGPEVQDWLIAEREILGTRSLP